MTVRGFPPGAWAAGWVVVFGAVALPGCGSRGAAARGTVTLDGKPLSDGSVNFEPADGQGQSAGAKITDGRYEVPPDAAMAPGRKKVTIRGSVKTGRQVPAAPPAPPGLMTDELIFHPPLGVLPDVVEVDVTPGGNEQSFDLKSKAAGKPK